MDDAGPRIDRRSDLVGEAELARRYPRCGALLLTLPLVSILAFATAWTCFATSRPSLELIGAQ